MTVTSERLKQLRKEKDMSLEEFSKVFGSTKNNFSNYERGKTTPRIDKIKAISKFCNVSSDWILGRVDDRDVMLLSSKEIKGLEDVPELYLAIIKDAIESGIPPKDLAAIVALQKKLRHN